MGKTCKKMFQSILSLGTGPGNLVLDLKKGNKRRITKTYNKLIGFPSFLDLL
jgi:hypothetical protein